MNDRQWIDSLLSDHRLAKKLVEQEKEQVEKYESEVESIRRAQSILQTVAQALQVQAHEQIASIVTRCLDTVFGEGFYEFKIDFQQKRGKTEAKLLFIRNNKEIDPLEASGGGVIDVAAFALRLASIVLAQPQRRRLMVLDEPFRFLSKKYRSRVRQLIEVLAKEMQFQFIIVTHAKELVIGKAIELGDNQ